MSGKNKQHGITHSKTMFGSTDVDQGKEYLREFLREHPVSKHAAFLILQEVFISGGGERVYGEATKGTAALEDRMLVHCSKDRCQIALSDETKTSERCAPMPRPPRAISHDQWKNTRM